MASYNAPLDRGFVDAAAPWLRALLGAAFVAYSANSTIFIGADHLMWLFPGTKAVTIGGFPDAYWYAGALALILFVGEVVCSERYRSAYSLFLWPDVFYTCLGIFAGLSIAMAALVFAVVGPDHKTVAEWIGWLIAIPLSIVVGYLIARWGEVLLFGHRRRTRKE